MDVQKIARDYERDGYVSGVEILTEDEVLFHRRALEEAEAKIGALHYKAKIHTVLQSPYSVVTNPKLLDIVEAMIGPDILLYDCEYIIKEPHTPSHVSWHQDLTFWGFNDDAQVSLWLALSPATAESGCMRMVPSSHTWGKLEHEKHDDPTNVLLQGQTVRDVGEDKAVMCPLRPGEASFHHGWTLHASMPNESSDRRIGLNAQFIAPHMRQMKHDLDTAILVRGEDRFKHFGVDMPAMDDFDPAALTRWRELNDLHVATQGS